MPLTFAHPAVILPFSRKSRYINFSALVLGSMSPDFEYFLRGPPLGEIGHTFTGFFFFNLPLVIVIYYLYHLFVHQTFIHHLPSFLQDSYTHRADSSKLLKIAVFCYCAWFGMCTHVAWDSFTHTNGAMVLRFPAFFTNTFSIYGFDIPLYKFLQHGSTLLGILSIIVYIYFRALPQRQEASKVHLNQKIIFWSSLSGLTLFFVCLWYLIDYVSVSGYGILVVRIIDSALISLTFMCLFFKYSQKKGANI